MLLPRIKDRMNDLREMENLFSRDLFKWTPFDFEVGISQDEQENKVMEVDVPGFNENNLTISKNGDMIFVSGENNKGRKIQKSMTVPVNTDDVKAKVQDGILEITFQEKEDGSDKKIPINSE